MLSVPFSLFLQALVSFSCQLEMGTWLSLFISLIPFLILSESIHCWLSHQMNLLSGVNWLAISSSVDQVVSWEWNTTGMHDKNQQYYWLSHLSLTLVCWRQPRRCFIRMWLWSVTCILCLIKQQEELAIVIVVGIKVRKLQKLQTSGSQRTSVISADRLWQWHDPWSSLPYLSWYCE